MLKAKNLKGSKSIALHELIIDHNYYLFHFFPLKPALLTTAGLFVVNSNRCLEEAISYTCLRVFFRDRSKESRVSLASGLIRRSAQMESCGPRRTLAEGVLPSVCVLIVPRKAPYTRYQAEAR